MSQFSTGTISPPPSSSPPHDQPAFRPKHASESFLAQQHLDAVRRPVTPPSHPDYGTPVNGSPRNSNSPGQRSRSNSRPMSMVQTYQPPLMDINEDTIPELQPIFTFLNSHSNKLYQEGYFLKLDDQNSQGKPNPDRTWTECFAQLVGTVLSLWDAAELDAAGEDGEVLPKFINLTDASIKMIDSLPTRSSDEQPLQNILSISTAGRNRYLLHFNSHHSLIQWTAGIRLAMYEHSTLQEAYTGALVAGKGKTLNNINVIMERSRVKTEEWVRVRFGAGVPWRRCWCVITPPDEKEYAKLQKEIKKRSPYDRSPVPVLKGDIKFYGTRKDGKKQKKAQPIATITDAYSAYAIYPQAKSLVDASTLLKVEGTVTVHSDPPSTTEGFIFIMPETHPAVSGFEMLLRFLFPTWDTFGLYGRPGRLVASVLDPRSLMFALPKHKRYGYLEPLDVSTLILDDGSSGWSEKEWRKRLKNATGTRMNAIEDGTRTHSRSASRSSARLSGGSGTGSSASKPRVGFSDNQASVRTSRSFSLNGGPRTNGPLPDGRNMHPPMPGAIQQHPMGHSSDPELGHARFSPVHPHGGPRDRQLSAEHTSSEEDAGNSPPPEMRDLEGMRSMQTPEPVSRPPAFNHGPQARPISKAYHSPELRRANSRLSSTTLDQMAKAGGMSNADAGPPSRQNEDGVSASPSVYPLADSRGNSADQYGHREALSPTSQDGSSGRMPSPSHGSARQRSRSPMAYAAPLPQNGYPSNGNEAGYAPRSHAQGPPGPHSSPSPHGPPGSHGLPAGPPRSPNFRPDQARPSPGPGPRGPPPQGRGMPPHQRPPPGHGPPFHEQQGNYGPGPGPRPYPGPQGRGGPPPNFHPQARKPMPSKAHQSLTPNDIIDHYTSSGPRGGFGPDRRHPPMPQQGPGFENFHAQHGPRPGFGPDHSNDGRGSMDRPRTSPGDSPAQRNGDFDAYDLPHRPGQGTPPQHYYGGNLTPGAPGSVGRRSPSPQPMYYATGRTDGPSPRHGSPMGRPAAGGPAGYPRPLRSDAKPSPGGPMGSVPGPMQESRNMAPQYQGQAF